MKKCPSCQKTYDDNMKFCQTDGTPLVVVAEDQPSDDPYKTMVASDIKLPVEDPPAAETPTPEVAPEPAPAPPEPVETPVVAVPEDDDDDEDVLEIPEKHEPVDPMKTIVVKSSDTSDNIKVSDVPAEAPSAPPAQKPPAAPPVESKESEAATIISPEIPKFSEPDISPPDLGADEEKPKSAELPKPSPATPEKAAKKADSKPSVPIPSPFEESMPPGVAPPESPPFDDSNSTPDLKPLNPDPEPAMKAASGESTPASPPSSPFAEPGAPGKASEPDDWSAPSPEPAVPAAASSSAPDPFANNSILKTAPEGGSGEEGENKTLAIVSLISGILSCICCFSIITGPLALITGFMARGKISNDPGTYGGGTFAMIGMILGVVGTILFIVLMVFQFLLGGLAGIQNF